MIEGDEGVLLPPAEVAIGDTLPNIPPRPAAVEQAHGLRLLEVV